MSTTDNLEDVPSAAEYRRVLPECVRATKTQKEKSSGGQSIILDLLKAHYSAPDRTATPGELAEAVGLPTHSAVNLRYGKFGGLLCEQLGRKPKFLVAILLSFAGERPDGESVKWTMHPQVVTALEDMGWVRRAD